MINISNSDGNKERRFDTISSKLQKSGMDENLANFYSAFSIGLNYSDKLRSKYFSELEKEGYNMIVDTEDSMLEAQAPIIVFNRDDKLKVLKTKELPKKYTEEWKEQHVDRNLSEDPKWNNQLQKMV